MNLYIQTYRRIKISQYGHTKLPSVLFLVNMNFKSMEYDSSDLYTKYQIIKKSIL